MAALSVYLDTSVVVPLFLPDPFVTRARAFFATGPVDLAVSDLVSAEFASVMGIKVRTGELTVADAQSAFASFDDWTSRRTLGTQTQTTDIRVAETSLRRLNLNLRALDAIHIAVARRLAADLATFDSRMAASARALGMPVLDI